mmetsp:Transcript_3416/g.7327  ORF Transcript_3416/g.7327 Transcript_3416/m.7327 type:complete len:203 (-) Transcript_3416:394-1002(-)
MPLCCFVMLLLALHWLCCRRSFHMFRLPSGETESLLFTELQQCVHPHPHLALVIRAEHVRSTRPFSHDDAEGWHGRVGLAEHFRDRLQRQNPIWKPFSSMLVRLCSDSLRRIYDLPHPLLGIERHSLPTSSGVALPVVGRWVGSRCTLTRGSKIFLIHTDDWNPRSINPYTLGPKNTAAALPDIHLCDLLELEGGDEVNFTR